MRLKWSAYFMERETSTQNYEVPDGAVSRGTRGLTLQSLAVCGGYRLSTDSALVNLASSPTRAEGVP